MNPAAEFQLMAGDEALIVAESLGSLVPVHEWTGPIDETTVQAPAAESAPA